MSAASVFKEWNMPGEYGCEKKIMQEVASVIARINPEEHRIDDIMTVIAEVCLNAIEHGNLSNPSLPVTLQMIADNEKYKFRVLDHGTRKPVIPYEQPLSDKWKEEHPRGWGLFLIRRLSDRFEFGERDGKVYVDVTFYR
ncbi:ATP-binding protein [Paenibacillus validus]|uniref:ATP-binding protein n=1 Tax=Paenibacillus validus TaxID=44253 RepID=UPI0006D0995B